MLTELFGMTRPFNGLMAVMGVLIGGLVAVGLPGLYTMQFLFAVAAAFLINGAGNVINDYFDVEADEVNRPERPIPAGVVSMRASLAFSIVLFMAGNLLALTVNGLCFTIAVANTILLILYSYSLQHKILIGNIVIGYLVGSVFLFGGAVFLQIRLVLILAALAMLANITREIVKDLEDVEGDKKHFLKKITIKATKLIAERFGVSSEGVVMKYRERTMIILAIAMLMLAIVMSWLPYYYSIMKLSYFLVIIPADIVFVSCIYSLSREEKRRKGYRRISSRLKKGMLIALLAFIAGALV
jgi:geranylgeranylglycerol-phosphate geranylgeranyltransferase